jgi:PAS domain S-box-containing protein
MAFPDQDTPGSRLLPGHNRILILYVDDETDLLTLGKLFLERSGEFRVDTMESAREALNSSRIHLYDAIISDYQMPGMDGIIFLKAVREQWGDIPFILFTGRGREEIVIEAINNGADFYIQKGGEPQTLFAELAHKIMQAVRRKQAEQELRRSKERYRCVVNDQTEMIERFTPDGSITFVNEAFRLFNTPDLGLDEIEGKNIHDIMQNGKNFINDELLSSLNLESPTREVETEVITGDKKKYWQLWTVRSLFDEKGNLVEYQLVGRDITRRKEVELALQKSKEKLNLLSEITRHDILNQLNILYALCDFCEMTRNGTPSPIQCIDDIRKCVNIIHQSISFTRDYQMLGNNAPVWQNIEKISRVSAIDNLPGQIVLSIHTGMYEIFADPMLMLVFYNLYDNAKKYGEKISAISVSFKEEHDYGVLVIEDNGTGIPPEMKEEIFQKGVGKNTGFGLFLAREILSITDATIQERGVFGQGARFEIIVPPGMWRKGEAKGIMEKNFPSET